MNTEQARNFITGIFCTESNYALAVEAAALEAMNESAESIAICEQYEPSFSGFADLLLTIEAEADYLTQLTEGKA